MPFFLKLARTFSNNRKKERKVRFVYFLFVFTSFLIMDEFGRTDIFFSLNKSRNVFNEEELLFWLVDYTENSDDITVLNLDFLVT